ncbi:MAG: aminoglycoside phosphotransferase, partial [Spirochaetia bacterium]
MRKQALVALLSLLLLAPWRGKRALTRVQEEVVLRLEDGFMQRLAHLHAGLASLPARASGPVTWLCERHARVSRRPAPPLPTSLHADYDTLLTGIAAHLGNAQNGISGPVSWLHGDYHAGNLLFVDTAVSGILDFDEVGQGSPALETAFALFALARDTRFEDRFVFDGDVWETGLQAYASLQPDIAVDLLRVNRDALIPLFCADQVLIHLEAAQRGLWTLGPGIGFLGCWHQLLADMPTRLA